MTFFILGRTPAHPHPDPLPPGREREQSGIPSPPSSGGEGQGEGVERELGEGVAQTASKLPDALPNKIITPYGRRPPGATPQAISTIFSSEASSQAFLNAAITLAPVVSFQNQSAICMLDAMQPSAATASE